MGLKVSLTVGRVTGDSSGKGVALVLGTLMSTHPGNGTRTSQRPSWPLAAAPHKCHHKRLQTADQETAESRTWVRL